MVLWLLSCSLIEIFGKNTHKMRNDITITSSMEFVARQTLTKLFMVVYFSIYLNPLEISHEKARFCLISQNLACEFMFKKKGTKHDK